MLFAVLDFRRNRRVTNYLGSREQRRALVFVGVAGLVALAVFRYGGPPAGLFARNEPPAAGEGQLAAQNGETTARTRRAAVGASEFFPGVRGDYLSQVEDDTVFRSAESDAWFHLLALLEATDQRTLEQASQGRVGFLQLDQQSAAYRGRLVTIAGVVRSAKRVDAPENGFGIRQYYQLWLQPQVGAPELVVVYALELPKGFPLGPALDADCTTTGFFFKRWAYQSRGGVATAPLIVARTIDWQPPPAPVAAAPLGRQFVWALVVAGVLAALIFGIVLLRTRGGAGRRIAADDDRVAIAPGAWEPEANAESPPDDADERRGTRGDSQPGEDVR